MRIFYASDTTPNAAFASNLWRNNLLLPLLDLGNEVVEFDYDLRQTFMNLDDKEPRQHAFIQKNRPKVTAALLKQIKEAHTAQPLDLFFSYLTDACITPEAIEEIKALGITTVNWYCNGSYRMDLVEHISPRYDWCLVPEKFRLPDYVKLGAHPIYCQEAANPTIYKPYDLPYLYDVAFIGQAYGERPDYIRSILDAGINLKVWGFGWERFAQVRPRISPLVQTVRGARAFSRKISGKPPLVRPSVRIPNAAIGGTLSDEAMIKTYSQAKINLGFSTCGDTHLEEDRIMQIRLRDFEVPMSGGFYMVEYMEELEEFYEIGKEIVCYSGKEDLADKIKYYLTHDAEREQIRKAGFERCLRDHTWHKRFQESFKQMGLTIG